jgi:hypothetical protein
MSEKHETIITIEGWRPWREKQKSAVAIRINDKLESEYGLHKSVEMKYLWHLRHALKALFRHEARKCGLGDDPGSKWFCFDPTHDDVSIEEK